MTAAEMVTAFKEVGFERVYHITHMANLSTVMA